MRWPGWLPGAVLAVLLAPVADAPPMGEFDPTLLAGMTLSSVEEIAADLEKTPCRARDRRAAVAALFAKTGAAPSEISYRPFEEGVNLTLALLATAGAGDEAGQGVIVGAHYDKETYGCGAVDNWTGVVVLAHLYRTLRAHPMRKLFEFHAFDQEEEGLLGAKAALGQIAAEERSRYCAMINLDSLGLGRPGAAPNLSSPPLTTRARELGDALGISLRRAAIAATADSHAFRDAGIPAITLHGLGAHQLSILHSSDDQVDRVDAEAVHQAYRVALALALEIDRRPCADWR